MVSITNYLRKCYSFVLNEISSVQYFIVRIHVNFFFLSLNFFIQLAIVTGFYSFRGPHTDSIISWKQVVFYIALSSVLTHISGLERAPIFVSHLRSGDFVRYLIRPLNIYTQCSLEEAGRSLSYFIEVMPVFLCTLSYYFLFPFSPLGGLLHFLCFIVLAFNALILANQIALMFYALSLLTIDFAFSKALIQGLSAFLSGSMVPLVLWPDRWAHFVKWSPFAATVDAPIRYFLKLESFENVFLQQGIWLIIITSLGQMIFHVLLPKYKSFGG